MTPLLTIEEAAGYLRVSKTSLRRWTNEGRLECVRVGARAERRFRKEDLERFIQAGPQQPGPTEVPAGQDPMAALDAAAARGIPRHVSLHHHNRDEMWRLFQPYVAWHLRRRAPLLWVYEAGLRDDSLARLRGEGIDPDQLIASDHLRLLDPSEAYLRTGAFDADRMVDFMESAILDFRSKGHKSVLISGEMVWSLGGAPGVDGMIDYEGKLNDLLRRHPGVTIVCHYDLERLGGKVTLGALCTHPHVQLGDRLAAGLLAPT
jgi:excisionase family DNA binding protein